MGELDLPPLRVRIEEARLWTGTVDIPSLKDDPMLPPRTIAGQSQAEVQVRALIETRPQFTGWATLVGSELLLMRADGSCPTETCGVCWVCRATGVRP